MPAREAIGFRRLHLSDLPLLHGWLNEPHVKEWWGRDGVTFDAVVDKYGPRPEYVMSVDRGRLREWALRAGVGSGERRLGDEL